MKKKLQDLIDLLPKAIIEGNKEVTETIITDLAQDSRKITPGTLFVCLSGAKTDGHDYIVQAYHQGAVAVLVEKDIDIIPQGLIVIKVANTREAMMKIAPFFFEFPSCKLRMIGVTGTNGKTTTTYLIRSILQQAGFQVGVIGTIQNSIGDKIVPTQNTTPDVIDLQRLLAQMAEANMDYVVMEVSSHALALNRVAGCEFDVGIFTNMTRDHLDFHVTFERYLEAKTRLFQLLSSTENQKKGKTAILNTDDKAAAFILERTECKTITYGIEKHADLQAQNANIQAKGTKIDIAGSFGIMPLQLKITGLFNVYNVLAAVGAALAEGIDASIIKAALEKFQSVSGRFELVDEGQPFSVIVDYAHTPDGLENILKTAQQIAKKRIIVVFGCGGDRDKTKRPIMGRLAVQYGNVVIATSDNPRTEDPETILNEIEAGIRELLIPGKIYEKISDRRQAIERALHVAEMDDIVIIAGKGHENYQILKDRTISFDDKEVVKTIIQEMK
ncbi:UDP-N-acetylmuramoyl-L-alanyl-D-glutamate--2,6-diaminopimelate ligase [Pelosinus propionicus]|uniref:UDP-N-acetylmuramoyl-L-alanyl-D-glutamate--2,6-diaminopimelate ligase n=1 Tax=Pelosinus propionicus DSM 13327 TaxID=1123291 RepID=A0A1I4K2Q5_9FIRM|nr:UDP-N-acetylmuramoyl-L-alanyl-D-glutamate--2,6-diaminopimelate ligase [Pelosinus propionicus]SFL73045.1 UDP-N-acetylmuramoylalanyl-D-glutamate--2,6-diaminopimelate ligase [Pelosinus propionicus DSM 13327]